jgi:hypothetical protein
MVGGRFPTSGALLRTLLAHTEHRAELQDTCNPVARSGKPLRRHCRGGHLDAARAAPPRCSWEAKNSLTMWEEPEISGREKVPSRAVGVP